FELDGSGNIVTEYVHGPGIDEPIAMIRGGQTYYYHADGLGSIIAITDSYGRVVQRYEYNSFGEITYIQDPNFIQPYTYTGREYDTESGLYYYRARYYDAKVGRFLQQDPFRGFLRYPQTQNPYPYVWQNPVNWVDPFGLIVQHCSGPSRPFPLVDHHWIKTDTKEAGMGPVGGGEEGGMTPIGDPTEITDHSKPHSRSSEPGSTCEEVKGVDEDKVNKELEIGKPLGPWGLHNNCRSFVDDVLRRSRTMK
ncbi:MAG: RHS repeat-associated core domain-containing protein, partial [Nitrospirota bacterium]